MNQTSRKGAFRTVLKVESSFLELRVATYLLLIHSLSPDMLPPLLPPPRSDSDLLRFENHVTKASKNAGEPSECTDD